MKHITTRQFSVLADCGKIYRFMLDIYFSLRPGYEELTSEMIAYRKPNCKGLQIISEKFAIPITKLIFIGDKEKDRRTAMNANCKFIRIQRTEKNKESIDNLNQLLQVLE